MEGDQPRPRRVLVVGGTGLIGGHAALQLVKAGHHVTLAARKPVVAGGGLADLPFQRMDYIADALPPDVFRPFDTIMFASGNDTRHAPAGTDLAAYWQESNVVGIPRFLRAARDGGVGQAIVIGSFYPQASPSLIGLDPYVASRHAADEGARRLATDDFNVTVLNAPYVIGHVDGLRVRQNSVMSKWALGRLPDVARFTVPGGVNVISADTLSDAVLGAIRRGRNGWAYLLGDENLSFQQYFGLYFQAAGDFRPLDVKDQFHPLISGAVVCRAPRSTIFYEPDPNEVRELGYRRGDVARTIQMIVDGYKVQSHAISAG